MTLQDLIEQFVPEIRAAFIEAIRDVTDRAVLAELERLIGLGDIEGALRSLALDEAALRPLIASLERAFETGGVFTAGQFPKRVNTPSGRTVFHFNVRNSRAERWLREESSRLVTSVVDETRQGIRDRVELGARDGRNPRNTALDIIGRVNPKSGRREGGIVGLTNGQQEAVNRARDELQNLDENYFTRKRRDKRFDRTVAKAIRDKKPLKADEISKIVGRYSDELLQLRGETIARTESVTAFNRSEWEALKQAEDIGAINASATQRVWDSAGRDGRTRDTHLKMDGQAVGVDEAFTTPGGARMMHPGDGSLGAPAREIINCRCRVRLKIDFFKDVD